MLVTLIGYTLLLKGALHLIFPKLATWTLRLAGKSDRARRNYRLAGVMMLPLALAVCWIAYR